jgi:hypothetical protein
MAHAPPETDDLRRCIGHLGLAPDGATRPFTQSELAKSLASFTNQVPMSLFKLVQIAVRDLVREERLLQEGVRYRLSAKGLDWIYGAEQAAPKSWEDTLTPGDERYVPAMVRPQMPDVVARALAAGATAPFEYMGAGMTGVVFCSAGVAFKVARGTRPVDHSMFGDEAEWLIAAAHVKTVRPHVARLHRFDNKNLVIVRDCPRAGQDMTPYSYGEAKLHALHNQISREMLPHGWTSPEFKPDSYIITPKGPVLVDASMPHRVGKVLAEYIEEVVRGDRPLGTDRPSDLAFYAHRETDERGEKGTLTVAQRDRLLMLIEARWPGAGAGFA